MCLLSFGTQVKDACVISFGVRFFFFQKNCTYNLILYVSQVFSEGKKIRSYCWIFLKIEKFVKHMGKCAMRWGSLRCHAILRNIIQIAWFPPPPKGNRNRRNSTQKNIFHLIWLLRCLSWKGLSWISVQGWVRGGGRREDIICGGRFSPNFTGPGGRGICRTKWRWYWLI